MRALGQWFAVRIRDAALGQVVASPRGLIELRWVRKGVEARRRRVHDDRRLLLCGGQRRIAHGEERLVRRHDRHGGDQHAGEHYGLAPDAVRGGAGADIDRHADQQRHHDERRGCGRVDQQCGLQEHQRIELCRVPAQCHRSGHDERREHRARVLAGEQGFANRRFGEFTTRFQFGKHRRFGDARADVDRERQQQHRGKKWDAPAPGAEVLVAEHAAADHDDEQRQHESHRRRGLDPARVKAALRGVAMLRDVDRCAAEFAAEGEPLQQAQQYEQGGRPPADGLVRGQHADQSGRQTHQHDGDQEGALAAHAVAEAAEDERAERANRKSRTEGRQAREQRGRFVSGRKEQGAEERDEAAVEQEVVVLEDGAGRCGQHDLGHRCTRSGGSAHVHAEEVCNDCMRKLVDDR